MGYTELKQQAPVKFRRRVGEIGAIARGVPARWMGVMLLGSMGAAWAFSPSSAPLEPGLTESALSRVVVEGEPSAVCELMGAFYGEGMLSDTDRKSVMGSAGRRIVLQRAAPSLAKVQLLRDQATVGRVVEDVEATYVETGAYPALPASGGGVPSMSYRADGDSFKLSAGGLDYDASLGWSSSEVALDAGFVFEGFLGTRSTGWGPWRSEEAVYEPGAERKDAKDFKFLEDLPVAEKGSARLFFTVDEAQSGYLFRHKDGTTAYSRGELTYDRLSGSFALKLFRADPVATCRLSAAALEQEAASRDAATVFVGEAGLLHDLGLVSDVGQEDQVLVVSSPAPMACSATSALDGLRLATLQRHEEALPVGQFAVSSDDDGTRATLVGSVRLRDNLGQVRKLRLRAGRGVSYDWMVGQVSSLDNPAVSPSFTETSAYSYEKETASSLHPVKAGM